VTRASAAILPISVPEYPWRAKCFLAVATIAARVASVFSSLRDFILE